MSSRLVRLCITRLFSPVCCFSFHDSPAPQLYTLSLHDALPILLHSISVRGPRARHVVALEALPAESDPRARFGREAVVFGGLRRSEEHTSELQSRENLVCRLLLEKKKKTRCSSSGRTSHSNLRT